jgi:two-component system response regulator HydG
LTSNILVVDDDRATCELLEAGLSKRGFRVTWRTTAAEALPLLASGDFDVLLTDLNMGGMNGLELCQRAVANRPDVPVVVITAFGSLDTAVGAIRAGAYDFITKPFEMGVLAISLERAVQNRRLRDELRRLQNVVAESQRFDDIVGTSPAMRRVYDLIERIAETDASVLITGESGTGKELVARAVHRLSRRREGPYVALNCSAVPEALIESELFGHERGAFTDAKAARKGLFVQASAGTLFLDEIGELPMALQPKLLRALQERTVRPVGSDAEIPFDARIVSASNQDLESAVTEGTFREDLFYRINVVHVPLPPLRSRGTDVLLLAQSFIDHHGHLPSKRVTGLSLAAAQRLLDYAWPGNVRELHNCLERAIAVTSFEQIVVDDLPEKVRNYSGAVVQGSSGDEELLLSLEEIERRHILRVLHAVGGSRAAAAERLGIDRKTLYRKLERWGVDRAGG